MKILLAKDWTNPESMQVYKAGTILEVDDATAKDLIFDETAGRYKGHTVEDASGEQAKMLKLSEEDMAKMIKSAVAEAIESTSGQTKLMRQTKDEEDMAKTGGFKSFGHFLHDMYKAGPAGARASDALTKWDGFCHTNKTAGLMQEADDEQGGYLVPTQFMATLLQKQQEASIIESRATFIPMQTNSVSIPYVAESSRASTLFGGIIIYRPGEGALKTASKPAFGLLTLTLKKLVGFVNVTDELLEDSPISVEPLISSMFGQAINFTKEEDFLHGTGAGQALGILNSGCLVSQAAEGAQAADTIVYANIIKMWSRLYPSCANSAVWMANMAAFPQLATMSVAVGTGGAPAYLPANGAAGAPFGTLLGKPLFLTEHCSALGDLGDIVLADWSQYLIGGKPGAGIQTASSIHLYFNYDKTAYRFVLRYDGQPWWQSALTPKHGGATATMSPFVALAAR